MLFLYFCSTPHYCNFFFFFFNDTATTEIYTLSLHDALPISFHQLRAWRCFHARSIHRVLSRSAHIATAEEGLPPSSRNVRSEEHTSELQSQSNLVCRLLLEKKKKIKNTLIRTDTMCYNAHGN